VHRLMGNPDKHNTRMRAKLAPLAVDVASWKDALDAVSPACSCTLPTRPGFVPFDNVRCDAGRHCLAMTVLTVRTHMGMVHMNTRRLSAAAIPAMVADLAALFADLPTTTDWLTFAKELQRIVTTGTAAPAPARMAAAPTEDPPGPACSACGCRLDTGAERRAPCPGSGPQIPTQFPATPKEHHQP
jgi:hypothetical protein